MKDRVRRRMDVVSAMIARVGRTADNPVMFCNLFADFAENSIRIEKVAEPFEAGRVIGKLALHILEGEGRHFRFWIHGITYSQVQVCLNQYLL